MKRQSWTVFVFTVMLPICAVAQTNDLTYQGRLTDGSVAANGAYDFIFRLFDDPTAVTPVIGGDQVRDDVPVLLGVFTVNLNFGATAFDGGGERYLEIYVRPGASTGTYALLTPRQRVTSSPFSMRAAKSNAADSLSPACVLCVTDAQIASLDGGKITGTAANAANAANATTAINVSGVVPIANGGTGNATKNFVDLSTNQTQILGNKTFAGQITLASATFGSATFNSTVTFNNADPVIVNGVLNVGGAVTAEQFSGSGEGLSNVPATGIAGVLPIAKGGTGSSTQNFVDLTTSQSVGGNKSFSGALTAGSITSNSVHGDFLTTTLHAAGGSFLQACLSGSSGTTATITSCPSSSIRYKSNIGEFAGGLDLIRRLRPVSFTWKHGNKDVGLIAEEVAMVEPLLITRDFDGQIEGVKYDRLGVVLINVAKEQQEQIDEQRKLIERQQKQIEALKKLVCAANTTAEICKE